ncbi:MAG: hypothetical protein C0418_05355 [Coriobacteriaceae bacterium]|nr:hypothetical protein [Coriobacteriaceae bacterium]
MPDRRVATLKIASLMASPEYCTQCVGRLCDALGGVPGILSVDCDSGAGDAEVAYDADLMSDEDLRAEAERLGYELFGSVAHAAYRLTGLD